MVDIADALLASIPSPSVNGVHLGPLTVRFYGLLYVVAVTAAILITRRRWAQQGGDKTLVFDVAMVAFPAGLVGGRIYYLVTSWNEVPSEWWGPFAVWKGGLGIWGGVAAGTLAGIWMLRRRKADIPKFMDAAAPGLLVAQAIGRIGNYTNQELFGKPSGPAVGGGDRSSPSPKGYESSQTFQPTFLYEIGWNLALAGLLVWLGRRFSIRPPGIFALYVAGYSLGRIFEELVRIDPSHYILGLRLNFFVAGTLFVAAVAWFWWTQTHLARSSRDRNHAGDE